MTSFAETALCFDAAPDATPLHVVRAADYATWTAQQPDSVRNWIAATSHRGDVGTIAWIPSGPSTAVLAVVGNDPLYGMGDLPFRLPPGNFRAISLPDDVDASTVNASYRDGVLQISVARRESAQPKRITVQ